VANLEFVYEKLKKIENAIVYKREDIPSELRIKNNVRVGDLMVIAKIGYTLWSDANHTYSLSNKNLCLILPNSFWFIFIGFKIKIEGGHGFLNNESAMHPFFIAFGPRFKQNFKIEPFNIVDIYSLMCSILKVRPAKNNGSFSNVEAMLSTMDYHELDIVLEELEDVKDRGDFSVIHI
jgi:hypothetical protein